MVKTGVGLNCLEVNRARSKAIISPSTVTIKAASLINMGIVRIGFFIGRV